ncbi:TetR/AcrR family transcriptional regulator [Acaryochloris marina]|uniref:TetR/AcrR family transcriptional regulator n=2 Tax=Acaryochloris TaxID=155977 RepID=UPI001BAF8E46|nr:TetR/AcrR family transcriptional regulator [Acaryochloris marina]QUY44154.1 TetR family transcriptional regulator [Acaryochloris marina S15]
MAKKVDPIPGMHRQPKQARSRERVNKILDVAEEMFIAEGCNAVTTNAIAAKAEVPIGSLYQFFPDKAAIVQALAARYTALHSQKILAMGPEIALLPFSDVLALVVDTNDQFFADYPGYQAIYMQMQATVPELAAIEEAADVEIIDATADFLSQHFPGLDTDHYQVIAMVIVKSIGTFLWLSRSQPPDCRQRLLDETKRLVQSYALSYWPEQG